MPPANGKSGNEQKPQNGRLDGWKDIADYLGRDIRTCQRWALKLGLPVHRIDAESSRAKVFAFQSEIEDWLKTRDRNGHDLEEKSPVHRFSARGLIVGALFLGLIVAGILFSLKALRSSSSEPTRPALGPVRAVLRGKSLAFFDGADRMLWDWPVDLPDDFPKYTFGVNGPGHTASEMFNSSCVDFADVDGDGRNEAAAFLFDKSPNKRTIVVFDDDGKKIIWEKSALFAFIHPGIPPESDVIVRSLSFQKLPNRDTPSLLGLWNTYRFSPSNFTIFDGKSGERLFQYDHIGNIDFCGYLDFAGRPYIFLGGTNNLAHGDAICAVLDPGALQSGLGPPYAMEPGSSAAIVSESPDLLKDGVRAGHHQYIRIRRTPLSEALGVRWMWVKNAAIEGSRLFLTVEIAAGVYLYYFFDSDFRFIEARPSSNFIRNFDAWRQTGKVALSLEEYLRRRSEDVSYWDGNGWSSDPTQPKYMKY